MGVNIFSRQNSNDCNNLSLLKSLEELEDLAKGVGANVIGKLTQNLKKPTPFYLGIGKIDTLKKIVKDSDIETIICDDELHPSQQRNLEKKIGGNIKIIDRTALILDVFASRAKSREGKLQVSLAQHEYLLPRLIRQWTHLERLGGGIGTRGPGETQIETDRRLIRRKIHTLKAEINTIESRRDLSRRQRKDANLRVITLIGYTNAGKSTLFNRLTGEKAIAKNQYFVTLDPLTRKIRLPSGEFILVTDTVGFIHKLPPSIIAAFRSTIEEINQSSILLYVNDISHSESDKHKTEVEKIIKSLNLDKIRKIYVENKIDKLKSSTKTALEEVSNTINTLSTEDLPTVFVSAKSGANISALLEIIDSILTSDP